MKAITIDPTGSTQLVILLPTIPVVKPKLFTNKSLRWSCANTRAELNCEIVLQ